MEHDPFEMDGVVDDLRADISQLEDQILGLEHDLEIVAEVLRAMGVSLWGRSIQEDHTDGIELTEDQAAVLERVLLL